MQPSLLIMDAVRHAGRATCLEPVVFDGHIGALHLPKPQAPRGVAVVLCPPVGRDARCAYRPLYLFAEALAAQGVPVLRYDHLGDGDSMPLDAQADCWPLWVAGVEQAAAFARAHTGAQRLVLAGLRIGASLAACAAHTVRPDGLMLLAPLPTGRGWVRELQAAASKVGAPQPADGALEVDGLRLSSATVVALDDLDLRRLGPSGAETFLAMPTPDPRLAVSLGARVRSVPFDGYAELFREAHLNAPPGAVFEAAGVWLEGIAAATPDAGPAPPPAPAWLIAEDWTEGPVTFGEDLRGVLCLPARPAGRQAVIFGNAGGDPRAGIGGFCASACRALAGRGVAALRFDFAGLGESASPGAWRSPIHDLSRTSDFQAAADVLAGEGYGEVTLAGVCSGGYQALRAAIEDARFRRIVTINASPVWRPDRPFATQLFGETAQNLPSGSRRAPAGAIGARAIGAGLVRWLRRRLRLRRLDAACRSSRAEIARIAADGARVRLLFGSNDAAWDGVEEDFGLQGRWLARQRGVEVALIRNFDRGPVSRAGQDLALAEILRFVGSPPTSDAAAAQANSGGSGLATSADRQAAI